MSDPHLTPPHLSEEQFADLLADEPAPLARQHLDACPLCQAEFARVRSALLHFNAASLAWAERRAPGRILAPPVHARPWFSPQVWSFGSAAVVAAAILFGMHERSATAPASSIHHAESESVIAADNRLLENIDRELQVDHDLPVPLSDLGSSGGTSARTSPGRINN